MPVNVIVPLNIEFNGGSTNHLICFFRHRNQLLQEQHNQGFTMLASWSIVVHFVNLLHDNFVPNDPIKWDIACLLLPIPFLLRFLGKGTGAPCFGGRTTSLLVKFERSILFFLVAYFGHLGYCNPHLMNKKADFGCKVLKKWTSKTEKMRKCPKTADFGHVLVYSSNYICFAWILP